ncbi:MAG: nucleoside-triphosphatase [Patescibacteria group bacterium]|nr:nucleoside-triphosphatase [Patescibacteria group bacterium]
MRKNVLITGLPKSGKSTLLKKLLEEIPNKTGFVTNEILNDNSRTGFEIQTSTGKTSVLASIDFKTGPQVSRYFVDIKNLDLILPEIAHFNNDAILYIDEIGQMELYSGLFKQTVLNYLDSNNICLATISKIYNDEFTDSIKARKDVILIEITEENRESKKIFIKQLLNKIAKAKSYAQKKEIFSFLNGFVIVNSEHGPRHVEIKGSDLACDCNFFQENHICSHVLAVEEIKLNESQP